MPAARDDRNLDTAVAEALVSSRTPRSADEAVGWLERAARHRVHILLADRWIPLAAAGDPALRAIRDVLTETLRAAVVVDAIRDAECRRVYAALSGAGVRAAVLKGAALAHTLYRAPYLRPRCDTDILIDREDARAVARLLIDLGYEADIETSGDLVTAQSHFSRVDAYGTRHPWDVHWRVSNAHAMADILSLDRIETTGLRPAALEGLVAPCAADALLLACVHRVAHHRDGPDLIWLYDIHLLAHRLSAPQWDEFAAYAETSGAWPLCARGLVRSRDRFKTELPGGIGEAAARDGDLPIAGFAPGSREIDVLRVNLRALPTWSDRARLLKQHLFPPAAFVVEKYRVANRAALPWAYLRRIVAGAPKWFRRHGAA
jgi:hypothetical protein